MKIKIYNLNIFNMLKKKLLKNTKLFFKNLILLAKNISDLNP